MTTLHVDRALDLMRRLFNVKEACEYLGFKRATLYECVSRRKIPFVKVGSGRVRFDVKDLDVWIDENKVCRDDGNSI